MINETQKAVRDEPRCRNAGDSYHVSYLIDADNFDCDNVQTEVMTHVFSYSDDEFGEQEQCGWVIEQEPHRSGFGHLRISIADVDFDVDQYLSETVCSQLADFFNRMAIDLRDSRIKNELADAIAKAAIQDLPFEEKQENR